MRGEGGNHHYTEAKDERRRRAASTVLVRTDVGGKNNGTRPAAGKDYEAYTRREREKFEALNEAHAQRMKELMTQSVPLSPSTSAGGASLAASPMVPPTYTLPSTGRGAAAAFAGGGRGSAGPKPPSLHDRLSDVQRHFEEMREQWTQNAC